MTCDSVGKTNPDIGGIGIIIAFALQAVISAVLSAWSFIFSYRLKQKISRHDRPRVRASKKKRDLVDAILLFASDTQTLNGIALLISGLSQIKDLDLYHLHILYDTVNFTSISNCAAIVCSFRTVSKHKVTRLVSICLFLVLYLAFTITFGLRLREWDETKPGHCYNPSKISHNGAKHPNVDYVYLAITCMVLVGVLGWALIGALSAEIEIIVDIINLLLTISREAENMLDFSKRLLSMFFQPKTLILALDRTGEESKLNLWASGLVLFYAALQLPLHLYSVIALRVTNQSLLEGDSENAWGFGQVVAMVMVGATLSECWKGAREWYDWKDETEEGNRDEEGDKQRD